MGYYTKYNLECKDYSLIPKLRSDFENAGCAFDDEGDKLEECKWYDHEKDMRKFSKQHPQELFTLRGEGEESADLWIEYYKGGLMQRCKAKIVYDPFSERELV